MTKWIEVIKQIVMKTLEAQKPVHIVYGMVVSVAPIKIKLSQQQILTEEFFMKMDNAPEVVPGDQLILFRVQGGQQYLIAGKKGDL